jgi:FtsP/CotA-like multicopper oxidase with cupredoxin domain
VRYQKTRRAALKAGFLGAGGMALNLPPARSDNAPFPSSPATTPFLDPLPMAPVAQPVAAFPTLADPTATNVDGSKTFHRSGPRQVASDTLFYRIEEKQAFHSFHQQLPPTSIWGYNGIVPGPTIFADRSVPSLVRFVNKLPENDPAGIGEPVSCIHRHGGFQAPEDDGYPLDTFAVGQSRDYYYKNDPDGGLEQNEQSTLWYHDHAIDVTAPNVYRGLAGFFLNFDARDSLLGEDNPDFQSFRLPGKMVTPANGPPFRKYDIPLLFQDKSFNTLGQLVYDNFDHNGFLGDKFLVNGKIQPYLDVERRKYRFRFCNGSNARVYEFFLVKDRKMALFDYVIGSDVLLFETPVADVGSIMMAPAERHDVVIDFSRFPTGSEIILENRMVQVNGRKPDGLKTPGTPILKFRIGEATPDASRVLPSLRVLDANERPERLLSQVKVQRTFEFVRTGGAWAINNQFFDENKILAKPKRGVPEIWTLKAGGGWLHPIHIHLSPFYILSRNGGQPPALQRGRKDTVVIGWKEGDVKILIKFNTFTGRYAFHCHNIEHEDMRMMGQFEVQP